MFRLACPSRRETNTTLSFFAMRSEAKEWRSEWVPDTAPERVVAEDDLPAQGQDQRRRVAGHLQVAGEGGIGHHDAGGGGAFDVHVLEAGAILRPGRVHVRGRSSGFRRRTWRSHRLLGSRAHGCLGDRATINRLSSIERDVSCRPRLPAESCRRLTPLQARMVLGQPDRVDGDASLRIAHARPAITIVIRSQGTG